MVKDTAVLNSGDKEAASSRNVKVKVTKNLTESFVTIVTVFSINSRYSNCSILRSVSIVSNVLLQLLLVMCIWVKTIYCHSRTGLHIQHVPPVNKFEWAFGSYTKPNLVIKCYCFIYKYLIQVLDNTYHTHAIISGPIHS